VNLFPPLLFSLPRRIFFLAAGFFSFLGAFVFSFFGFLLFFAAIFTV